MCWTAVRVMSLLLFNKMKFANQLTEKMFEEIMFTVSFFRKNGWCKISQCDNFGMIYKAPTSLTHWFSLYFSYVLIQTLCIDPGWLRIWPSGVMFLPHWLIPSYFMLLLLFVFFLCTRTLLPRLAHKSLCIPGWP